MAKSKSIKKVRSTTLMSEAKVEQDRNDIYANYASISATANELFIDYFMISPKIASTSDVQIEHVKRVVTPISIAKGLASAIANTIAQYEEDTGNTLPNTRDSADTDKIKIWE